jgi:hypothetical protein
VVADKDLAKEEAESDRLRLTLFTNGSRFDCGSTRYAVVWRKGIG